MAAYYNYYKGAVREYDTANTCWLLPQQRLINNDCIRRTVNGDVETNVCIVI